MRAVNLLPSHEPTGTLSRHRRLAIAGSCGFAAVSVLLSVLVLGAGSSVRAKQERLDALSAQVAQLPTAPGVQDSAVRDAILAEHDARFAAVATAIDGRIAWDRVLRQVARVLPTDVWLTSLSARTPGADPATQAFTISGSTYSQAGVARLLSRLAVVPYLANVQLVSSARDAGGPRGIVGFTISADVKTVKATS